MDILKGVGRFFYVVNPYENYEKLEKVPDYVTQATPYFISFIIIEYLIQWYRKKPTARLNDGIVSLSHGMFLGCGQLLVRGIEIYAYVKIYNNWRIYELPWDSAITWYIAALATDLGYYWLHRAAHEVNFLWANHQVHHSSEEYNITTALRQSGLQGWVAWIFYLPMAFFVPPPMYLIHQQFNIIFQFWIHTELVDSIGPLEYIFNTPKHHRIHHGSNRYCLDKNYAGVLIIWDRMFGTFAEQKPGEKIVYGLVEDVKSFNPFYLQFFYIPKLWNRVMEYSSVKDKLSVFFKGPGWSPGNPRLGNPMDVPEVPSREKFDVQIPMWQNIYVLFHFAITIYGFDIMFKNHLGLSQMTVFMYVGGVISSVTSLGLILENRKLGIYTEILRLSILLFGIFILTAQHSVINQSILYFYFVSITVWFLKLALDSFSIAKSGQNKDNHTMKIK